MRLNACLFAAVLAATVPATAAPPPRALTTPGPVTAVWANDGGDKIAQEELRVRRGVRSVLSALWDGRSVQLFGARNETVGFNLVLEAANGPAKDVSVTLPALSGPAGARIASKPTADPFDWVGRPIELFLVGYLPIRGLSRLTYETYDERHVPWRFRLPRDAKDRGIGGWTDRPDHDLSYPDIAQPMELTPRFSIPARRSQSVWIDVTIPKTAQPGLYRGAVRVQVAGRLAYRVPVRLEVMPFTLPDVPTARTMVATEYGKVAARYVGVAKPKPGSAASRLVRTVMDRQYMLAHRHRIALYDDNDGPGSFDQNRPRPEARPRLDGSLFTAANGYDGPGVGLPNPVYVIGPYGSWEGWWGKPDRAEFQRRLDLWETWFRRYAPSVDRMIYLADEFFDRKKVETWASWIRGSTGPGRDIRSLVNINLVEHGAELPSVDIIGSWFPLGDTPKWEAAVARLRTDPRKLLSAYNGHRPGSGSFAIEDDGIALRELAWGQWKMGIDIWQVWESTYYDDVQGGRGPTDVFANAQTFGGKPHFDRSLGMTGWNYTNGDGVLFYPGMDVVFPKQSRGLAGPIASLRLKLWRRGIQDVEYLALAAKRDPAKTRAIVQRMVRRALWETGVDDPADPTYVHGPVGWSSDPDVWEAARRELAEIIMRR